MLCFPIVLLVLPRVLLEGVDLLVTLYHHTPTLSLTDRGELR